MPVPHSDVSGAVVQLPLEQVGKVHTIMQEVSCIQQDSPSTEEKTSRQITSLYVQCLTEVKVFVDMII